MHFIKPRFFASCFGDIINKTNKSKKQLTEEVQNFAKAYGIEDTKVIVKTAIERSSVINNHEKNKAKYVSELRKEYLRTAAAKGISPFGIYGKHLLRNAALQVITRAGASLPYLFTGSLLLESFFGIPGLGFAGVDALYNSDLQLLKALVIVSALLFVVMNFLTDIAYAWADPRIRLGGK